ncbi:MAG: shikimate dehydrogenase [Chloroflexi bacterium]|nr:shikimate dehydrogenase [Chloroflexota bacterium]
MSQPQEQNSRLYQADGKPRSVGVIGYPIAHSLSPSFQNVAFEYHKLPHRYEKWEVAPADLPNFLEQVRNEGFLGLNLTLPHKQAALSYLDILSDEAAGTGAANTLFFHEGQLAGHNTDIAGFMEALKAENYDPLRQRTMVIGAGGAARAVVYALASAGANEIAIVNRTFEKAADLGEEMALRFPTCNIYGAHLDPAAWPFNRNPRTLVVNATSQAITAPDEVFPIKAVALSGRNREQRTIFFDLFYGKTPFLAMAEAAEAQTLDGLTMLVYQGAHSFELWTGLPAPRELMLEAARTALSAK